MPLILWLTKYLCCGSGKNNFFFSKANLRNHEFKFPTSLIKRERCWRYSSLSKRHFQVIPFHMGGFYTWLASTLSRREYIWKYLLKIESNTIIFLFLIIDVGRDMNHPCEQRWVNATQFDFYPDPVLVQIGFEQNNQAHGLNLNKKKLYIIF